MVLTNLIKLNAAGMLIALLAFSSFAQTTQFEPKRKSCDRNVAGELPGTVTHRDKSQSGRTKVELFPVDSSSLSSARSTCDSVAIASPVVKPLIRKTNPRASNADLLSFDSRAGKPSAGYSSRVSHQSTQGQGAQAPDSVTEAQELAKKLANPVASLISFPMQSNFDFGMGTGSGWRYTLNVQPVIPIALSPNWNMISRTIVPIIHQGNVTGPNTSQSGLGDTVQSLFFSPNKSEPFVWAVGPVFLLPTATNASLGSQKWGVGPTALALKQKNGWTYGLLANHIWSVAGKSNRGDVNATFVQPFVSYTTKDAWTYTINTESTYDWVSNSWSTPINISISKLVRFGKQPVSFGAGPKCWVTTPNGGPEGCALRIVVTALFPKR